MEAGLACPDWPLCYGNFFTVNHMNLRVFLEWFHRLDAFLVGILILLQFILSIVWRKFLPIWLPKSYSILLFLIIFQGLLGALTVMNILASETVIGHLLTAFVLLITCIFINHNLENNNSEKTIIWWKTVLTIPLFLTLMQSVLGVRLSSSWSAHLCLDFNQQCLILDTHRLFVIPTAIAICAPIFISLFNRKLFFENWKLLIFLFILLISQVVLGYLSLKTNLNEPAILVSHQLVASLLIATLSALVFRKKSINISTYSNNSQLILN